MKQKCTHIKSYIVIKTKISPNTPTQSRKCLSWICLLQHPHKRTYINYGILHFTRYYIYLDIWRKTHVHTRAVYIRTHRLTMWVFKAHGVKALEHEIYEKPAGKLQEAGALNCLEKRRVIKAFSFHRNLRRWQIAAVFSLLSASDLWFSAIMMVFRIFLFRVMVFFGSIFFLLFYWF